MFKKLSKKIFMLSLVLALGLSSTAFAQFNSVPAENNATGNSASPEKIQRAHKDNCFAKLYTQLGLRDQDIKNAQENNQTLFDLAKAKGYSQDQVRSMFIKNKTDFISQQVANGKMTQEQGKIAIEKMKEKVSKWDGSLKPHGRKGMGMGFAAIKELGLTKEDISSARQSGKTIFDIAKEKKGLSKEQVKSIIIKSKTEAINKKVSEGKLPKDQADKIIAKMKVKIENWDGSLKPNDQGKNKQ